MKKNHFRTSVLFMVVVAFIFMCYAYSPNPTPSPSLDYYRLDKCEPNGTLYYAYEGQSGHHDSGDRVEGGTEIYYVISGSQKTPYSGRWLITVTGTGETDCPED